jgi:phage baseplate assembly protein W
MAQRCIALPFKFTAGGEVGYTTDYKKINQDRVIGVLMTLYSERVMTPTFGTAVRKAVFETESEAESLLSTEIRAGFSNWLSDLKLNKIEVSKPETDIINVTVNYSLPTGEDDVVNVKYGLFSRSGDVILEDSSGRL